MIDFRVTVDASKFYNWVDKSLRMVQNMQDTMYRISEFLEVMVRPRVPYDKGYLEHSVEIRMLGEYPMYETQVRWSGEANPNTDFDYAYTQEVDSYNHPIKPAGRQSARYVEVGLEKASKDIFITLKNDYISALGGK